MKLMERIVVDPKIMAGKPVVRGTRVTVDAILRRLAEGMTFEEILKDFPYITKEDIKAAIRYAESLVSGEEIFPIIIRRKYAVSR